MSGFYDVPILTFRIELEENGRNFWFKPGDDIKGKVLLENSSDFFCFGIRVALEGLAVVSYPSGDSFRKRIENLLPDNWTTIYFIGNDQTTGRVWKQSYVVRKSSYEFEFTIPIRKLNPFPGTFKGKYGEITYRVAAYIDAEECYSKPSEAAKVVNIRSSLNLTSVLETTLKPAMVEGREKKSFFSSSKGIIFSLSLPHTGFLPGEEIPFNLKLTNSSSRGKDISKVIISLLKKMKFKTEVSAMRPVTTLAFIEIEETDLLPGKTIEVADVIKIPEDDIYPSFTTVIMQNLYSTKVEIFLHGTKTTNATIVGEIPITIGTVREIQQRFTDDTGPIAKSLSLITLSSNAEFSKTLHTSHSSLSSRRPSVEKLPPWYGNAIAFEVHKAQLKDS